VTAAFGSLNQTVFQNISEQETIISFDSPGPSVNTILDILNDRIIVTQSGVYEISISIVASVISGSPACSASLFINNTPIPISSVSLLLFPIQQQLALSIAKTIQFPLSANDVLDVRVSFTGNGVSVANSTLTINRIF
ncbi:TPA: hypothetical protein QCX68_001867, partial [Bacillus wiedmannii]|nr:hypothetical protein [Bacillus wiedmannii]